MNFIEILTSIKDPYIGNIAAVILAAMLIAANSRRARGQRTEHRLLMHLIGNIGFYSIIEIVSCILDGVPGTAITVILYILNTALFVINMLLASGWVQLISYHLGYAVLRRNKIIMMGIMIIGIALLIANIFTPMVFFIEDNVYSQRGPLYFVFVVIAVIYFLYSITIYFKCKHNGGVLKYFPVCLYIVPSLIGIILESWLGSSFMSICNGIALCAVLLSLRQEEVFKDRLTGLYNRAYLEEVKSKLEKTKNPYVSGIMLDLNGFKRINDNFGHTEGDHALENAASLLRVSVNSYGDVIRYAGDEFVVILNTLDKEKLESCILRINKSFEDYNLKSGKPYQLTVSMGYANFNAETQTVNEFLNTIDKDMYENKRKYYDEIKNKCENNNH